MMQSQKTLFGYALSKLLTKGPKPSLDCGDKTLTAVHSTHFLTTLEAGTQGQGVVGIGFLLRPSPLFAHGWIHTVFIAFLPSPMG